MQLLLLILLTHTVSAAKHRCTYGESCWPSSSTWAAFNASISGRLIQTLPPAAPCHTAHYNPTLCAIATSNWTNGYWRADQPGAMESTNWEGGDNQQCYIDSATTAPCQQGLVPVLVADVRSVQDIQKAVNFAAKHRLRTVIKNTGHDYLGRSAGAGSFAIWTHHMKGISFTNSFVPDNCKRGASAGPAVTLQAGELWSDVYQAADAHNVTVVGGAALSVGAAGGWAMGGGHSPLSHKYGLGVDNALQYTIVTADGNFLTANSCQNEDLFWALRGGGGGTFGVATSVTYKTHPPLKSVETIFLTAATVTQSLYTQFMEILPTAIAAGYSGYLITSPVSSPQLTAIFFNPQNATDPASDPATVLAPLIDWSLQNNQSLTVADTFTFPSFYSFFTASIGDIGIGINQQLGSRLLPSHVFQGVAASELANLAGGSPYYGAIFNIVAGGAVNAFAPDSVSVHPAWRTALALVDIVTSWPDSLNETTVDGLKNLITAQTQSLSQLVGPGAGAYANEADPPDWKDAFWGSHYPRLLQIKKQVDPDLLWTCNVCVGSDL